MVISNLNSKAEDKSTSTINNVTIDAEKRICINGKPFFPIGMYAVRHTKNFSAIKKMGFNTIHTYDYRKHTNKSLSKPKTLVDNIKSYLTLAEKHKLKVFVQIPKRFIQKGKQQQNENAKLVNKKMITYLINTLKNSPALLTWYLADEPGLNKTRIPAPLMHEVANLTKNTDPNHPHMIVLCSNLKAKKEYITIPDIMMTDEYPSQNAKSPLDKVTLQIESAYSLMNKHQALWNVVQLQGKGPGGNGYGKKEPNFLELKNMAFQSIACGVNGLLYWGYDCKDFKFYKSAQGIKNVTVLNKEIISIVPIILSDRPTKDLLNIKKNKSLRHRIYIYKKHLYLLAVNLHRKPTNINVSAKDGSLPTEIVSTFDGRRIKTSKSSFQETINPLGVKIYRMPLPIEKRNVNDKK